MNLAQQPLAEIQPQKRRLEVNMDDNQELVEADTGDDPPPSTALSYYDSNGNPLDCDLADLLTDPQTKLARSADDQCTYVKVSCTGDNAGSVFNFVYFYYCSFHYAFGSAKLLFFIPAGVSSNVLTFVFDRSPSSTYSCTCFRPPLMNIYLPPSSSSL